MACRNGGFSKQNLHDKLNSSSKQHLRLFYVKLETNCNINLEIVTINKANKANMKIVVGLIWILSPKFNTDFIHYFENAQ
jgi:hypothetical protein